MAATNEMVQRLRRMTAEPDDSVYTDEMLKALIEQVALRDERGSEAYVWDATTQPPTKTENAAWVPTYDLHAAAAEIWDEKAAGVAGKFDFQADGGGFDRSQVYEQYQARARYHRTRRASKTMTLRAWPEETTSEAFPWIGNLPETED